MKTSLFFLVLLNSLLSMGFVQSCPSYEVGSSARNKNDQRQDTAEGHVYLNMNEAAVCSGTVYGWRYCYDPNDDPPHTMVLAMYRPQQNGSYQLVPGSYYPLTIEEDLDTFSCRSTTLEPSEYFTVQENDVVAVCEPLMTLRVELFFRRRDSTLQLWNAGGCSESQITSSPLQLSNINDRVFLLSAIIDMNECDERTHNCHKNATCSDVVGGFNCSCNTGFTGNGSFCEDIDECDERTHNCHENATCSDVVGGFNCSCNTGFTGNGTFCEYINECDERTHNCHENATCSDVVGGFYCSCNTGFAGNGTFCEDAFVIESDVNRVLGAAITVPAIVLICVFAVVSAAIMFRLYRNKKSSKPHTMQQSCGIGTSMEYSLTYSTAYASQDMAVDVVPNEAYGVTPAGAQMTVCTTDKGCDEIVYQTNGAYGITKSATEPGTSAEFSLTHVTAHDLAVDVAPNEAYGVTSARAQMTLCQ